MEPDKAHELGARFQRVLAHRGPDGTQTHHDADTLLVHRRLAIIDLSQAGAQPLWNETGTICVIVNGEIYNFPELRRELIRGGHQFRSHSDSEVIVHLYEDRGIDACCLALEGMFAFALWDSRSRELYLVRDRLGIKPLVIAEHAEGLTFGSSLSAILADPDVPRDLREEALASVMKVGFVPSPWSALRAARRLIPGSWIRVRAGRVVSERKWWTDAPASLEMSDREVQEAISRAVERHLLSDVPVGSLLSAGIDSGIVTALAARAAGRDTIEAWTVSHRGHSEDEMAEAQKAASHFGVVLHEIPIGGDGLSLNGFDAMVAAMDEPLVDASLIGLHELFRSIASDRRVVLSGDGGDELFGGYDRHVGLPAVPAWAETSFFRAAAPGVAKLATVGGRVGTLGKVAAHVHRHPASVYLDKIRIASDAELVSLGIESQQDDPLVEAAENAWDRFQPSGILEQMLAVDRATSLADQMLAKIDTSSMAYSVESRVPLLGDGVVSAAKALPARRKRRGSIGKLCLREWYGEIGPPMLADRAKTGFNAPVGAWLNGQTGAELRERAAAGLAMFEAGARPTSNRQTFAAAVLASWVDRARSGDSW